MIRLFSIIAVTALVGCGPTVNNNDSSTDDDATDADAPDDGDDPVGPHVLASILVDPTDPLIELDLNMPGSQAFTATGYFMDGQQEDLTGQVTWTIANPNVGVMNGSTLEIPGFAASVAEVSRIGATLDGITGEAQITVVAYRRSGPAQDFFFVLPYQEPTGPAARPLAFGTQIPALDVFFLMDTTGSMFGSITNLASALSSVIVPGVQAEVADSQFGVGAFEDFPVGLHGSPAGSDCGRGGVSTPDQPFHLFQAITADVAATQTGISRLRTATGPIGCGADWPESGIEAIYQAATGEGLSGPGLTSVPANQTGVGGVAFRAGTMPVIVQISDAMMHGPGETGVCSSTGESAGYDGTVTPAAHSRAQAKTALANICARVVGVAAIQPSLSAECSSQADLEDFATSTGALVPPAAWDVGVRPGGCAANQCCTGPNGTGRAPNANGLCPVVFQASPNGTGLGTNIVTGIRMLTRFATFNVTSERVGETADIAGNPLATGTTADFIKAVTPASFMLPPPPPNLPNPTFDATAFYNVTPGTQVEFTVTAFNDFVMQTSNAQIFRAKIRVLASGCTALDEREVLILVPPAPVGPIGKLASN